MTSLRRDYERLSAHEILTEASFSAARNEVEAAKLLDYNVVDYRLSCRRVELEQLEEELQEAETIIDRVVIELQLCYVNEELDSYQNRLLELSQTKPLQDLIHRELEIRREQEYEEFRQRCRERSIITRNRSKEIRNCIKNESSSLITYLTNTYNQKYVPEIIKKHVMEFLESIDTMSSENKSSVKWSEKMKNVESVLRALYNAAKAGTMDDKGMMKDFNMEIPNIMHRFVKENESVEISEMDTSQLNDLFVIIKALRLNIAQR